MEAVTTGGSDHPQKQKKNPSMSEKGPKGLDRRFPPPPNTHTRIPKAGCCCMHRFKCPWGEDVIGRLKNCKTALLQENAAAGAFEPGWTAAGCSGKLVPLSFASRPASLYCPLRAKTSKEQPAKSMRLADSAQPAQSQTEKGGLEPEDRTKQ